MQWDCVNEIIIYLLIIFSLHSFIFFFEKFPKFNFHSNNKIITSEFKNKRYMQSILSLSFVICNKKKQVLKQNSYIFRHMLFVLSKHTYYSFPFILIKSAKILLRRKVFMVVNTTKLIKKYFIR